MFFQNHRRTLLIHSHAPKLGGSVGSRHHGLMRTARRMEDRGPTSCTLLLSSADGVERSGRCRVVEELVVWRCRSSCRRSRAWVWARGRPIEEDWGTGVDLVDGPRAQTWSGQRRIRGISLTRAEEDWWAGAGRVGWGYSGGRSRQAVAADLGRRWRQIWAGAVDERVWGRGIRE
jgi:hypothetical protein